MRTQTAARLAWLMVPIHTIRIKQAKDPQYKRDILASLIDGELRKLEDEMMVSLDDIAVNGARYLGVEG